MIDTSPFLLFYLSDLLTHHSWAKRTVAVKPFNEGGVWILRRRQHRNSEADSTQGLTTQVYHVRQFQHRWASRNAFA